VKEHKVELTTEDYNIRSLFTSGHLEAEKVEALDPPILYLISHSNEKTRMTTSHTLTHPSRTFTFS
jgi:hypothetical protein